MSSDAPENTTIPAANTRLRPIRSPARPPNRMKPPKISVYMLITHCRLDGLNRSPRWIEGSATLTIVASSTTMNWATQTITTTSHGLTVPVGPPVTADSPGRSPETTTPLLAEKAKAVVRSPFKRLLALARAAP